MSGFAADPADSLFTWVFRANSGDSWGGWLVEDSSRYVVGSTLVTPHGAYTITVADPQGTDLSGVGLQEGMIHVEWYWDGGTRQFLVTRAGPTTPVGLGGLGSELDAAWGGTGWEAFGGGGAFQANTTDGPDSQFRWLFVHDQGDSIWGTLHDNSDAFAVGDTLRGAAGTYRILEETPFDRDTGTPEGTVTTTRYRDAQSALDLQLESGGAYPTGLAGLGSEADRAFDGRAWVQVGLGGAATATRNPDASFSWVFEANSGDRWGGWLVGHAPAWAVGDTLTTPHGTYRIQGEQAWAGDPAFNQNVWVVNYLDGQSGRSFTTQAWSQGRIAGTGGLGSEYDLAWNGVDWDDYGRGGARQADAHAPTLFAWQFHADSGDRAIGWVLQQSNHYALNETWRTEHGRYEIYGVAPWTGPAAATDTVWFIYYWDGAARTWLGTERWHLSFLPVEQRGLGNEVDRVWNGYNWETAGRGGAQQADMPDAVLFAWRFRASSGDIAQGWVVHDYDEYTIGQTWTTAHGRYEIYGASAWSGPTVVDGTVFFTDYFDSQGRAWLGTESWHLNRRPVTQIGLGNERDRVWDGDGWDEAGLGGALQADVETVVRFTWTFRATSGDRYIGQVLENAGRYTVGQTITTAQGRYEITGTAAHDDSALPMGTVWFTDYFDAAGGTWLGVRRWHLERRPVDQIGLGQERDLVWDGDNWDEAGLGGALQANVEPLGRASADWLG